MVTTRPETLIWMRSGRAKVGRPAERSHEQITAAAMAIADQHGLDAVSMRRVAAALGTGAPSLYRYVATRDDLLDLMIDSTGAEYSLPAPTGDWLADLVEVGNQARTIMRRHPWLPSLVITRATLGPQGVNLLEHVLDVLAGHPAATAAKLKAFAILMAVTATFVQHELTGDQATQQRQSAYLQYVAAAGTHPRLAALLATAGPQPGEHTDRFPAVMARILTGLLPDEERR
jgi:AcrR family transcriptional regulator